MARSVEQRVGLSLLILALVWLAVFGPGLVRPPLMDDVDASHAGAGKEILTRGDWVTLHENGIRYLEKAPLPYWGMAVAFKLFGVAAWTARLSLHLSVLVLAWFLYFFGRRFLTARSGFWAGVLFLATIGPYLFTRMLIPDVTVGLWIGICLYFFLDGWQSENPTLVSCWAIAAVIGLNVLTKGLIGVVFPCAIMFVFLLLARDLRHLRKMHLFSSTADFSSRCRSLAPFSRPAKSAAGTGERLPVVLFRERAVPALYREALSGRLRNCSASSFLWSSSGLVFAVEFLSSTGAGANTIAASACRRRAEVR